MGGLPEHAVRAFFFVFSEYSLDGNSKKTRISFVGTFKNSENSGVLNRAVSIPLSSAKLAGSIEKDKNIRAYSDAYVYDPIGAGMAKPIKIGTATQNFKHYVEADNPLYLIGGNANQQAGRSQYANAYKNIRSTGPNTWVGECNNGHAFSGTYVKDLNSYTFNGPAGGFSVVDSKEDSIRKACGD